jgi:hypothetical protein
MQKTSDNEPNYLTPQAAAALIVAIVEKRGGRFLLRDDDTWFLDLDSSDIDNFAEADKLSRAALGFRDEIRAELKARAVQH